MILKAFSILGNRKNVLSKMGNAKENGYRVATKMGVLRMTDPRTDIRVDDFNGIFHIGHSKEYAIQNGKSLKSKMGVSTFNTPLDFVFQETPKKFDGGDRGSSRFSEKIENPLRKLMRGGQKGHLFFFNLGFFSFIDRGFSHPKFGPNVVTKKLKKPSFLRHKSNE